MLSLSTHLFSHWSIPLRYRYAKTILTFGSRREEPYEDADLQLVIEGEPEGQEKVAKGLHRCEEGEDNPVHHPLHVPMAAGPHI
jgi:hypothetical protein